MMFVLRDTTAFDRCLSFLKSLNTAGKLWGVEIKPYVQNRTNAQNRLYWAYVGAICDWNGDAPDDLHEELKRRFIGTEERMVLGVKKMMTKSSRKLSRGDFGLYLLKIEELAKSLGIRLPVPDDRDFAIYGRK